MKVIENQVGKTIDGVVVDEFANILNPFKY